MDKETLLALIEAQKDRLMTLSGEILDHPEVDGQEYFAAELLTKELESLGFAVERGVFGLQTAFRAVWKNGEGGPNIGILGEYDALRERGHGCGHHMQTPAAIGAVYGLKQLLEGSDIPCTLTVYGTPAEETFGGKIVMAKAGAFRELDVALGTHATAIAAAISGGAIALHSFHVDFHGKSAHASGRPWGGRSAADAMILMFHGIEFMREHVLEDTRIHYAIREGTGPANVVPDLAQATVTLRSYDNKYLQELEAWLRDIVKGACLMTGTTADIVPKSDFASLLPNLALAQVAKANYDALGIPTHEEYIRVGKGSTDFGNVSCIVPSILMNIPYTDKGPCHSQQWVEEGKGPCAVRCVMDSAKMLALTMYDLITDPAMVAKAKAEFAQMS